MVVAQDFQSWAVRKAHIFLLFDSVRGMRKNEKATEKPRIGDPKNGLSAPKATAPSKGAVR